MLNFVIRDDDVNAFTDPERLEKIYGSMYHSVPVSFAVVPFQANCNSAEVPPEFRGNAERCFPLGDNKSILHYLRSRLVRGAATVMLHGYSHANINGLPEYVGGKGLVQKTVEGKRYLESILPVRVRVFVPPHNSLSRRGATAVASARLDVLGAFGYYPWERAVNTASLASLACIVGHWMLHGRRLRWPRPVSLGDHQEFYCYGLVPGVSFEDLRKGIDFAARAKGDFCVATHYWELWEHPRMRDILMRVVDYALKVGLRPCTAERLFQSHD